MLPVLKGSCCSRGEDSSPLLCTHLPPALLRPAPRVLCGATCSQTTHSDHARPIAGLAHAAPSVTGPDPFSSNVASFRPLTVRPGGSARVRASDRPAAARSVPTCCGARGPAQSFLRGGGAVATTGRGQARVASRAHGQQARTWARCLALPVAAGHSPARGFRCSSGNEHREHHGSLHPQEGITGSPPGVTLQFRNHGPTVSGKRRRTRFHLTGWYRIRSLSAVPTLRIC